MPIALTGLPFDEKLIPELEARLTERGFRLEEFAFAKNKKSPRPGGTYSLGLEYEYTVSISGKRFSITFSNDSEFVRFFYNLCLSSEGRADDGVAGKFEQILKKAEGYLEITKHWLTEAFPKSRN